MKKQDKNDFINIFDYAEPLYPFQIFVGGRGLGKTYSALSGASVDGKCDGKFILMRRTANELDIMLDSDTMGEGANPFKEINDDFNVNFGLKRIVKNLAGIYQREDSETGKPRHIGTPIGYGVALSTMASIRGISFSDCTDCFYDEFIPEKHVKKMKGEFDALMNAYETINRNREFIGKPPLRLWLLANSNDIYNPIFSGLKIVSEAERMQRQGKMHRYIKERGLAIHLLPPKESFRRKKSQTALYKLTEGSDFADMALNNSFAYNDFSLIGYRQLQGYIPVCSIGGAYIYRKKGGEEYYVTYAPCKTVHFNSMVEQDVIRFRQQFGCMLQPYFVAGKIIFESYQLKQDILALIL